MRLTALVPVLWLAGVLGLLVAVGWGRGSAELAEQGSTRVAVAGGRAAATVSAPKPRKVWRGKQGVRYERSYRICSVFTVKEVARELGVPARRKAAALAHANAWYDTPFRRAAYRGCLDAFRGRPPALG